MAVKVLKMTFKHILSTFKTKTDSYFFLSSLSMIKRFHVFLMHAYFTHILCHLGLISYSIQVLILFILHPVPAVVFFHGFGQQRWLCFFFLYIYLGLAIRRSRRTLILSYNHLFGWKCAYIDILQPLRQLQQPPPTSASEYDGGTLLSKGVFILFINNDGYDSYHHTTTGIGRFSYYFIYFYLFNNDK